MSDSSILLVKTSSLGDVIHALPAVSDIRSAAPESCVDWVVEESLTPLPRLHPGVAGVIPIAVRRWRRTLHRMIGSTRTWRRRVFLPCSSTRAARGNTRLVPISSAVMS